jgi:predicted RND superfamily exporter protein
MRRFFAWVTKHPVLVLSAAGLVSVVLGLGALGLRRNTSPDAFIPPAHPALVLKQKVEASFGLVEPIAVGVISDSPGGVFTVESLRLIHQLTGAIQRLPDVAPEDVMSLATEWGVVFREGEPGFERLLPAVPRTAAEAEAVRRNVLDYELYRGTLAAADGSAACVLIRPRSEQQADAVYRALRELLDGFPAAGHQLVVGGEAAARAFMGTAVSDDALRMNFVCPVVMAGLIALAYRSVGGTLLPLCVVGGASLAALGSMALSGVPVYIVTNGIFVVIMALGVADAMHVLGQYDGEQRELRGRTRQAVIADACAAVWYPALITSVTDMAGFFSLYATGVILPLRYFGLFTCVGCLGALLYTYFVVPAGLAILPLRPSRGADGAAGWGLGSGRDRIGDWVGAIGGFAFRRSGLVLGMSAAAAAVAVWGASQVIVNDSRLLAFKEDHPLVRAAEVLNARFDGLSHLNIVVTADEPGGLVRSEMLRRIEQLEAFTETLPLVGGTHSLAGWVKRAHEKLHEDDPAFFVVPDDPEETRYYLDVLGAASSPMARLLREIVDPTRTETNLILRMKSSQYIHERPVVLALEAYLQEHFRDGPLRAQLAGRVPLDYHWVQVIWTSHVRSVGLTMGCVLLLIGLMFRSLAAGLLCTLVVGITVLVNYGLMGLAGIPLGVGTTMFASIAIGVGVNFPIYLLDRLRSGLAEGRERPDEALRTAFTQAGRPLFFTAMVVGIGFLLLCISEFRTLAHFGLLIGTCMLVSFLASITLLPAVLAVWRPRFLGGAWGKRGEVRSAGAE